MKLAALLPSYWDLPTSPVPDLSSISSACNDLFLTFFPFFRTPEPCPILRLEDNFLISRVVKFLPPLTQVAVAEASKQFRQIVMGIGEPIIANLKQNVEEHGLIARAFPSFEKENFPSIRARTQELIDCLPEDLRSSFTDADTILKDAKEFDRMLKIHQMISMIVLSEQIGGQALNTQSDLFTQAISAANSLRTWGHQVGRLTLDGSRLAILPDAIKSFNRAKRIVIQGVHHLKVLPKELEEMGFLKKFLVRDNYTYLCLSHEHFNEVTWKKIKFGYTSKDTW